jgi:conjugal transfer pilus assembly protein TrbC
VSGSETSRHCAIRPVPTAGRSIRPALCGLVPIVAPLLTALLTTTVQAQAITSADERRAAHAQPQITDADIEAARRRHAVPALVPTAPSPRTDRILIEALPQPQTSAPLNLERIAEGLGQATGPAQPFSLEGPRLLIFISLSMPVPTLQRLIDQAERAQAILLLRGMDQASLVKTVARVRQLIGTRRVDLRIDPEAFDLHQVNLVPSFVLTWTSPKPSGCSGNTCRGLPDHLKLAGDVSLDHALSHFSRASSPHRDAAALYLKRLGH